MRDRATIEAEIAALRAQRASGVASIRSGERMLTYRGDADIAQAIGALNAELRRADGTKRPRRLRVLQTRDY